MSRKNNNKFENGLFIFRRDLRLIDNNGLNLLNERCKNIYTIFIFTPEQVGSNNKYKADNAVQFMIESLQDLSQQIGKNGGQLFTFYGHNEKIVEQCIRNFHIDVVCFNLDASPYARSRDEGLIKLCQDMKTFVMYDYDYYLYEPGTITNGTGEPYKKFTPYYEMCLKRRVEEPKKTTELKLVKSSVHLTDKISLTEALDKFTHINHDILVHGGRQEGILVLKTALQTQKHYGKTQHELSKPTSQLSAYINFGCLSIREIHKAFRGNREFIRQLIWGSFYANILYNYPNIINHSFNPKYDRIRWHHNEKWFIAWCNGNTNFPIVDACMRELNTTGFLHGRGRLIVSSFLVKILMIDYKKGEKYFANHLTDYNISNNLNNWMWITGNGASAQAYFRIFNPWLQSKEHDPECIYIKKWVPELENIPAKDIHKWSTEWIKYHNSNKNILTNNDTNTYPYTKYGKPICDYESQKEKSLKMYKDAIR